MKRPGLVFAVLLLALSSVPLKAAKASSPEERKRVVEATKRLEQNPLGEEAKQRRGDLFKWWIEVPDLTLTWCAGMLIEVNDTNMELAGMVVTQAPLSAGAAMIEHPEVAKDKRAFAIIGIEAALRAYQVIVAKDPKMRNEFLEGLQKEGALGVYVDSKLPACK